MEQGDFCARVLARVRHATPEERDAIARELAGHLEDHAQALEEAGYPPEEARARAEESMGDPEEIGAAMNRLYPLGWLVLSRVTAVFTALLCLSLLFTLPLLGTCYSSVKVRLSPESVRTLTSRDEHYDALETLDLRVDVGSDVLRIYQVGLQKTGDGGLAAVAMVVYDRSVFGLASDNVFESMVARGAEGDQALYGSGGGDAGHASRVAQEIPVTKEMDALVLVYDAYGEHREISVPLPWEDLT